MLTVALAGTISKHESYSAKFWNFEDWTLPSQGEPESVASRPPLNALMNEQSFVIMLWGLLRTVPTISACLLCFVFHHLLPNIRMQILKCKAIPGRF